MLQRGMSGCNGALAEATQTTVMLGHAKSATSKTNAAQHSFQYLEVLPVFVALARSV